MVRFTLFGVPVEIQPWFWVSTALLGLMGTAGGGASAEDLRQMVIFMFAATISILVHEFGHALTGRRLGGGYARVFLIAFGGFAMNEGGRFTRWQRFWMVAAGPGAGFALFLLVMGLLAIARGPSDALGLTGQIVFGIRAAISEETFEFFSQRLPLFTLLHSFLWINFWWGVLNLLPVLPLDGGRIAELFIRPPQRVFQVAIFAACAAALFGLSRGSIFMALFFGYLAWQNFQALKGIHGR